MRPTSFTDYSLRVLVYLAADPKRRATIAEIARAYDVKAWQCIGCGSIEAPQTCIGVCQHRKVQFVYADEHEEALAALDVARARIKPFEEILRRLAYTTPRGGEWERACRVLQSDARDALAGTSRAPDPVTTT